MGNMSVDDYIGNGVEMGDGGAGAARQSIYSHRLRVIGHRCMSSGLGRPILQDGSEKVVDWPELVVAAKHRVSLDNLKDVVSYVGQKYRDTYLRAGNLHFVLRLLGEGLRQIQILLGDGLCITLARRQNRCGCGTNRNIP